MLIPDECLAILISLCERARKFQVGSSNASQSVSTVAELIELNGIFSDFGAI